MGNLYQRRPNLTLHFNHFFRTHKYNEIEMTLVCKQPAPPPPPPAPVQQPPPPPPQPELKLQRPIIQYIEEPSLSSLRVRAEKEQELAEQERYWKQRLTDLDKERADQLEELQSVLVNLQTASMSQTLKGMQDQVGSVHTRSPVCPDLKEKITACLGANKGTPLNCSPLVQEFSRCVDKSRLSYSGRAG